MEIVKQVNGRIVAKCTLKKNVIYAYAHNFKYLCLFERFMFVFGHPKVWIYVSGQIRQSCIWYNHSYEYGYFEYNFDVSAFFPDHVFDFFHSCFFMLSTDSLLWMCLAFIENYYSW